MNKLSTQQKLLAAGAYFFWPVSGLILLFTAKNSFVRFHAVQSMLATFAIFIINLYIELLALWFVPLAVVKSTFYYFFWALLVYKAARGKWFKLPYIGEVSMHLLKLRKDAYV